MDSKSVKNYAHVCMSFMTKFSSSKKKYRIIILSAYPYYSKGLKSLLRSKLGMTIKIKFSNHGTI